MEGVIRAPEVRPVAVTLRRRAASAGSARWCLSPEASSVRRLLEGSHAGTGSSNRSRVRMSRHGSVVVNAGLLPTPGVAASRMVSKLAVVAVAAAYARIHARKVSGRRSAMPCSGNSLSMTRAR